MNASLCKKENAEAVRRYRSGGFLSEEEGGGLG
jgi:hypothetical protein